jgi:succinate dehydrogenase / fumarate reductase iron-sulfur subunit
MATTPETNASAGTGAPAAAPEQAAPDARTGPAGRAAVGPSAAGQRTAPGAEVTLRLWRGDASGGGFQDFRVVAEEGEVVLDVVHRVQATQAPDLAVRWNCKAGKCGSCSAEVNGTPRLMCMTRMSSLPTDEPVTITPLRTFPIIRDLVTDVSFNYEMARQVPPFTPRPREPDGTYRMQQVDIDRIQEFHKCIECFLCQNVCHVIRDHEENKTTFAGPRLFIRYAELDMHPLDTLDRRRLLRDRMGLGFCNITKCCTEVCPEGITITDNAIIPLKERVVDTVFDPVTRLGRRIRRGSQRTPVAEPANLPVVIHHPREGG